MTCLGLIPARKGSKRLPGKNMKLLGGQPLIVWTLGAAMLAEKLDAIVVSSDDEDVLELAEQLNCGTIRRPDALATDDASSYDVIKHALDVCDGQFDYVCLLQPTSPFRSAEDINICVEMLEKTSTAPAIASAQFDKSVPNGSIYVGHVSWLREGGNFDGPAVTHYSMSPVKSVDIDTPADWEKAEDLLEKWMSQ